MLNVRVRERETERQTERETERDRQREPERSPICGAINKQMEMGDNVTILYREFILIEYFIE